MRESSDKTKSKDNFLIPGHMSRSEQYFVFEDLAAASGLQGQLRSGCKVMFLKDKINLLVQKMRKVHTRQALTETAVQVLTDLV